MRLALHPYLPNDVISANIAEQTWQAQEHAYNVGRMSANLQQKRL